MCMKHLLSYLYSLNIFCAKALKVDDLDKLEESIVITLCKLERIFVPTFSDIMVHLTVHLVEQAKLVGPVPYHWMYPFER